MHIRRSKKFLLYIFLLILLGSINNSNINQIKFYKIDNIIISGLDLSDHKIILKSFENLNIKNIFFLNKYEIHKILSSNSLVQSYEIFKRYPTTINVEIKKTEFLARINNNGKVVLIGANGKFSKNKSSKKKLPFIFGKPNTKNFLELKKIIDDSYFSYSEIKNLYFFPSKRWDLELKNNIIIKLPEKNIKYALKNAFDFLNNNNLAKIKTIDLRVKNQIILND